MIDFSDCAINKFKAYGGGNGHKLSILYKGEMYMLKLSPKSKKSNIYTNACLSEYICCKIYDSMGFNTQQTLIGQYHINGNYKDAVACKDFELDGYDLMEFAKLKNTFVKSDSNGYGTDLNEILETIQNQQLIPSDDLKKFFWEMFIADSFLGNFDRHNGNWGLLVNQNLQKAKIAPIYDCGSCLYPKIDEISMKKVLSDSAEQNQRIFVFPTSAIKYEGNKINYFDFISNNINQDCTEALNCILSRINMKKIENIIDNCEISSMQKKFYISMLNQRKEKILDFSLQKISEYENKLCSSQYPPAKLYTIGENTFGWSREFARKRILDFKSTQRFKKQLSNHKELRI